MRMSRLLSSAVVLMVTAAIALTGGPVVAVASAACPDVEVIFARGRLEPPGPGRIGSAFMDALRSKTNKSVSLYSVVYPADNQIDVGANDMSQRIQDQMANCPDTRLVLGGYSLGAAVTDVVLAVPMPLFGFKKPLPPGADQHIAAIALFGNGIQWVAPISNFNPVYRERTIEMCHGADPICNPTNPDNFEANWPDHLQPAYIDSGMVNQAADFVAGRIN